eukprot:5809550-Pyramimonas_sp.AAC.1
MVCAGRRRVREDDLFLSWRRPRWTRTKIGTDLSAHSVLVMVTVCFPCSLCLPPAASLPPPLFFYIQEEKTHRHN